MILTPTQLDALIWLLSGMGLDHPTRKDHAALAESLGVFVRLRKQFKSPNGATLNGVKILGADYVGNVPVNRLADRNPPRRKPDLAELEL